MALRAIISDIHGNLEALTAVLADIRRQNADEIVCLGDIVGYGPDPCACLDKPVAAANTKMLIKSTKTTRDFMSGIFESRDAMLAVPITSKRKINGTRVKR